MNQAIDHYTPLAKWLHWIIAALIIAALALGFYIEDLPRGPEKTDLIQWHKAGGTLILALVVARLAWRAGHKPPALPEALPAWQQAAARFAHWGLYALMLAQPINGWLMSNAFGYPVKLLGLVPLPTLLEKNQELADLLKEGHGVIGTALAILVAGHAVAALKHHFLDRDAVLLRMLPKRGGAS